MGGKYEVRWKLNRKCPCWSREYTNDLEKAYMIYREAVDNGYTCVEMEMHDWRDCPADCMDREPLCQRGDA